MRAPLFVVLLLRSASAAPLGESARAPLPDVPTLPAAAAPAQPVAVGPAEAVVMLGLGNGPASTEETAAPAGATSADEARLDALFDRAVEQDRGFWNGLESALLSAVGSPSAARPQAWVRGAVAFERRGQASALVESLRRLHRLDPAQAGLAESIMASRELPSLPEGGFKRFFQVDGALYVKADTGGLWRLDGARWVDGSPIAAGVGSDVNAVARVDGALYAATDDGLRLLAYESKSEVAHRVRGTWARAGLSGQRVVGLREEGGRWLAETADGGLYEPAKRGAVGLKIRQAFSFSAEPVLVHDWKPAPRPFEDPARRALIARLAPAAQGGAVRDAARSGDLFWLATDKGLRPVLEDWQRGWKEALSRLPRWAPPGRLASAGDPPSDVWDALASAGLRAAGVQGRRSAGAALKEAAVEALRNAPQLGIVDVLSLALGRTQALDARQQQAARDALEDLAGHHLEGPVNHVLLHGDRLFAATVQGLSERLESGWRWLASESFADLRQIESIDGALYTLNKKFLTRIDAQGGKSLANVMIPGERQAFAKVAGMIHAGIAGTIYKLGPGENQYTMQATSPGTLRRLLAREGRLYAATSRGFFLSGVAWQPLADKLDVRDALFEDGRWWLATEEGLYSVVLGETPQWVPESAGMSFRRLRSSPRGLVALGPQGALRRQGRRWALDPELDGALDVLETASLSYVATESGLFPLPRLPAGWQDLILEDLARAAEKTPSTRSESGALLSDPRGRSLLGP